MVFFQQQGLVQVSGKQAASFLQGQITADIQTIDQGHCPLTAICNAKGRVLYTLRVIPHQSDYLLLLPKSMVTPAIHDLQKYARLSRVSLSDVSADYKIIGLYAAPAQIQQHFANLAVDNDRLLKHENCTFMMRIQPSLRLLAIISQHQLSAIDALTFEAIDEVVWDVMDIQTGLPTITLATQSLFTPHDLQLPALNGVSFNKGCYIGQEIVARMQYLGKLKQHTYQTVLETNNTPEVGAILKNAEGIEIGQILNCVKDTKSKCFLALVVMNDNVSKQPEWVIKDPIAGRLKIIA